MVEPVLMKLSPAMEAQQLLDDAAAIIAAQLAASIAALPYRVGMGATFHPEAARAAADRIVGRFRSMTIAALEYEREVGRLTPLARDWATIDTCTARGQAQPVIVAVTGDGRDPVVGEAWFDPDNYGGSWWWASTAATNYHDQPIEGCQHGTVTHWQPMPTPPVLTTD